MLEIFIFLQKKVNLERKTQHAVIIHANTSNGVQKSWGMMLYLSNAPLNMNSLFKWFHNCSVCSWDSPLNVKEIEMLCWPYISVRGYINRQLKMNFPWVWEHEQTVTVCWSGQDYTQEETLTIHLCYHTHKKLIFNWWLMHLLKYTYGQHNISNVSKFPLLYTKVVVCVQIIQGVLKLFFDGVCSPRSETPTHI